jgi:hypothetical protein
MVMVCACQVLELDACRVQNMRFRPWLGQRVEYEVPRTVVPGD